MPLRIMHVVDTLALAGTEYGVMKTVNLLDPARFTPWICCLGGSIPETRRLVRPDVRIVELNRRGSGVDWALPWRLAKILRGDRIQVIHSHNWATYAYAVSSARIAGIPVVIHGEHGRDTAEDSVSMRRRFLRRLLVSATDHFTAVSRSIREHICRDWGVPENRVTFIPNGVDLGRFGVGYPSAEIRGRLGVGTGEPLIGAVGEFRPVKDYMTLIHAFERVRRRVPAARLIVVGYDPDGWFASRLSEEPLEDRRILDDVRFPGLRTDIPEIMSVLDVYVNCSLYEGMSNTILEAMASRKPVVATAVGGTPDIVEEGGTAWLVPPEDPEALADRILWLLEDPGEAQRMGARGRARVERLHGYAAMVESNASLYESVYANKVGLTGKPRR
ncbi:MAG: glycosyltransferase [Candidatus Latescibacteria bacterium]|nr:glycosyltransferase [Candidatus Latescibacterota bacterium]